MRSTRFAVVFLGSSGWLMLGFEDLAVHVEQPRHVLGRDTPHPAFRADSQSRIPDGDSASTASISRTCSAVVPSSWTAGLVRHEREEKLG